jgi:predicted RNase H-like HicB family nuclease
MKLKYSVTVAWSNEDDCYIATSPEFENLVAFGDTIEEAAAEAAVALQGYIETHEEAGIPLPQAKTRPSYSGQIRFRMPKSIHQKLSEAASLEGVSLNTLILTYVTRCVATEAAVSPETTGSSPFKPSWSTRSETVSRTEPSEALQSRLTHGTKNVAYP